MSDNNKDSTRKLCFHEMRMHGFDFVKSKIMNNGYQPYNGYADEWLHEQEDKQLIRDFVKASQRITWVAKASTIAAIISAIAAIASAIIAGYALSL